MAKKTSKQLDILDIWEIRLRPVYSRSAQMPTVSSYIASLSPLHGRDVQFKRDTRALAIEAALKYADARGIKVENRAGIEARLERDRREGK